MQLTERLDGVAITLKALTSASAKLAAAGCSHTHRSQLTTGRDWSRRRCTIAPALRFWSPTSRQNGGV